MATEQPNDWAAVPDPDNAYRMTYWAVFADGAIRDYPHGARWRPIAPPLPGVVGEERRQQRQRWYDEHYYPWRAAVRTAIDDDPAAARTRFLARYPSPVWTDKAVRPPKPPRPRRAEPSSASSASRGLVGAGRVVALLAFLFRLGGKTYPQIAEELNVSEATARRRVKDGEVLAEVHRVVHRREEEKAEQRAAALDLLAGIFADRGSTDTARVLREMISGPQPSPTTGDADPADPPVTTSARYPGGD